MAFKFREVGTGESSQELGLNYINDNIETILNLPHHIANRKKKKLVICIDEFQNITRFENHPYYLQQLARNIWLVSGKKLRIAIRYSVQLQDELSMQKDEAAKQ